MTAYNLEVSELVKTLDSDAVKGLNEAAAEERLRVHGENKLKEKPKKAHCSVLLTSSGTQ